MSHCPSRLHGALWCAVVSAAGTAGCTRKPPAAPPMKPPAVTVAKPVLREIADVLVFTGRTEAVESVDVRARVGGYLNKVHFKPGLEVKQGDLLYEIDPRPYQAEVDRAAAVVAQMTAVSKQADIEFQRIDGLFKRGSAGKVEFDRSSAAKAKADAEVLAAQAALDRARLDLDWCRVYAPITGEISRTNVDPGNLISGGGGGMATLLTNIRSVDPVHCYFDVDERSLLIIQKAMRENRVKGYTQGGQVRVSLALAIDVGFPHEGTVDFVENRVDVATGTLRVRAVFPNPRRIILAGLFGRVRVPIGPPRDAPMVNERALGFDQGQRYVMVVDADRRARYRRVEVGRLENGLREIVSGLRSDEWVIVNGLQRARPDMPVEPSESAMSADHDEAAPRNEAGSAKGPATRPAGK